ncbi:IS200/IS605 family element transposase accessory protein TnpB [Bacillus aerolatus]|uniref:IS200/IS605 family element transposase accessory protein TnpB n=1 Tax=Bacillus aerolatus TaxID=2653354 RepID=A0A6I1FKL3_9BACI|nr:RNA-guided endonuclease TnpB family protein [Bacillus aerolatus]KAB7707266.1 IS200/IS605 family element transposase accessory protein TnpB [Bacillus aerolatus]
MYVTQSNQIRGLSKEQFKQLKEMCHYAKNLYNVGLYNVRQHYFTEKSFLKYESNYHVSKTNENYKLLQAGVSQQILKVVDRSFKSFFNLMKKAKKGEYRFRDIKIPKYLKKDGLFTLIFSTNAMAIKDGYFRVPVSNLYKKLNSEYKDILIPFPSRLEGKKMKEVRIVPRNNGQFFNIQYVYEQPYETTELDVDKALAIDIGLNNLASCVDTDGASFLVDGKRLKSINRLYNKKKARLQSVAMKQGMKYTKQIGSITLKRNKQVNDYMKKSARIIINYCLKNKIGNLVVGYNDDFKRNINIGKKNNQQFTQISFGHLREQLLHLCERYGIEYVEQEESYTSKASFFDNDHLPKWKPADEEKHIFSGKRVKRGLYRTSTGYELNADVNGALNILRKSNLMDCKILQARGCLAHPLRIRVV